MATIKIEHRAGQEAMELLTHEENRALLDAQAQRHLGTTWEQFDRDWNAGRYRGREEESAVLRLVTFLPLKGCSADGFGNTDK